MEFKNFAEARAAGYRSPQSCDRDVSGGNFFGYAYEAPDGTRSITVKLTEELNKMRQPGAYAEMFPPGTTTTGFTLLISKWVGDADTGSWKDLNPQPGQSGPRCFQIEPHEIGVILSDPHEYPRDGTRYRVQLVREGTVFWTHTTTR